MNWPTVTTEFVSAYPNAVAVNLPLPRTIAARLARLLDLPQIQISSENDFVIASNLAAFCCGKTPRIGSESDPVVGNARRVCFSEG
jgi:hypothetical protein